VSAAAEVRFGDVAAQLVANGYRPVPILPGEKRPALSDWPNYVFQADDSQRFKDCSAGVLTGFGYIALDLDVREPDAAAKLETLADLQLGIAPRRIGQAPKSARLYAINVDLPYLCTRRFRMPEDQPDDKVHKVEVLTAGKQLVIFGQHRATGRDYRWNGAGDPTTMPVSQLPCVTEAQIREFLNEADALLADFGEPILGRTLEADSSVPHISSTLGQRARDPREFREALKWLANDYDRDGWIRLAHSVKAALGEEGWLDFERWCQKSPSYTGRDTRRVWDSLNPERAGAGTLLHEAHARGWQPVAPPAPSPPEDGAPFFDPTTAPSTAVTVADFYAYMPAHEYIFVPTRELWPASSVKARCEAVRDTDGNAIMKCVPRKVRKDEKVEFEEIPMPVIEWLDQHRPVDMMTWAPGEPILIADRLLAGGGWIDRPGCNAFNLYRPPQLKHGDGSAAGPWLEHLRRVYPDDAEHMIRWLAHRVQRPGEKLNHALVLMGAQGIGKDSILEPIKHAVGPWNFTEVTPTAMLGRFNGFVKSVILRVNEARDLGELDRYSFYDHLKMYTAAPPDVIRCDEKNLREHAVLNVCGSSSPAITRMASICQRMTAVTTLPARPSPRRTSHPSTGTTSGAGITPEASRTSPPTSPLSTCRASIPKLHRPRRALSATWSTATVHPKTANSPTPLRKSIRPPSRWPTSLSTKGWTRTSAHGSGTAATAARSRTAWKSAATSRSVTTPISTMASGGSGTSGRPCTLARNCPRASNSGPPSISPTASSVVVGEVGDFPS
jgi:hypothetical protein